MIKSLINTNTNNPLKLIPIIIDAATKFDDENNGETQLAFEHAEAFANRLWLMSKEKIAPVEFVLRPDDETLQKYTEDRKRQCLKVQKVSFKEHSVSLDDSMNSEDQKDVLKQFAVSIAIQVESTKESNKISRLEFKSKVEKDKAIKNNMGKLHSAVRHQFLMAAPTDGEEPAKELPKSCKDFYNQESAPLPSQELVE